MEKVEKLFITHNVGMIGGANKSLQSLIRNLHEKADLVAPIEPSVSNSKLKQFFGKNINNVYRFSLPFRSSYLGGQWRVDDWMKREKDYLKNRGAIYQFMNLNKYNFIYLNSYVLYPLLNKKFPMYIHVRERFQGNSLCKRIVHQSFRQAKGIIYIDYTLKEALGFRNKKSMVLNNPFNQSAVLNVNTDTVKKGYSICDETVFTFISAENIPEKGLEFIADSFIKANCGNAILLVVGIPPVKKYKNYSNIFFIGTCRSMEEIYAISDYVIRGDMIFCIGRTVYEALYSGCNVIIPGNPNTDKGKIFEYQRFRDNINFYKPRDKHALENVFRKKSIAKKQQILGLSNEVQYIKKFYRFIGENNT